MYYHNHPSQMRRVHERKEEAHKENRKKKRTAVFMRQSLLQDA